MTLGLQIFGAMRPRDGDDDGGGNPSHVVAPAPVSVAAEYLYVHDETDDLVLYDRQASSVTKMASIIKVVTALTAVDVLGQTTLESTDFTYTSDDDNTTTGSFVFN